VAGAAVAASGQQCRSPRHARTAARQDRLDSRYAAEIEKELSRQGWRAHDAVLNGSRPKQRGAPGKRHHATATRLARPYAHPHR
jgi:hypothetical protein